MPSSTTVAATAKQTRTAIYARVSTADQSAAMQVEELRQVAQQRGWSISGEYIDEGISGATASRPALDLMMQQARRGKLDLVVVWKLDRLGRSMGHLVQLISDLGKRDVGFRSLTEAIDTTSAQGKLLFHIMGALAEFERSLLIERTRAGVAAAKKRGQHVGRPRALTGTQIAHARELLSQDKRPAEVAAILGVARSTLYRTLGSITPG